MQASTACMPSNPAKKVALYARVSCANGQSPEMQVAELREYAARRGWNVVGEYVDKGISGTKENRPELDCLWSDCRKGKVDAVVVYRYDRFARSLAPVSECARRIHGAERRFR